MIEINEIIYNDRQWNKGIGSRAIGVNSTFLTGGGTLVVKVAQKKKDGNELYPKALSIPVSDAKGFGVCRRRNVDLIIIPIHKMKEVI